MTRFARAKGSKSSNERAPEDGTPWEVMKEQLVQSQKEAEDSKKRQKAENQRQQNYDNFLKEQRVQKRPATWCDFPDESKKQKSENTIQDKSNKKKNKKSKDNSFSLDNKVNDINEVNTNINNKQTGEIGNKKQKDKKKNISISEKMDTDDSELNIGKNKHTDETATNTTSNKKQKNKKKNKSKNNNIVQQNEADKSELYTENNKQTDDSVTNTTNKKLKNKNKKKNKANTQNVNNDNSALEANKPNQAQQNNTNKKKLKIKKLVDGKVIRRKPIDDHSFKLIINGKDVELIRFDGFPVMKKDAERLQELKQNMIKKGIPKSEVQRTMKLERRRAEKALARLKRDVCYNCRKGGHNLSDCPELKTKIPGLDAADGLCFKCGSTEHKSFDCKVQKDQGFRFATCFICKEQGHIARQCPDNPKGLYPNGGGCKLCGDVTHLRKDCPTAQDKREESNIRLETFANDLEGTGGEEVLAKPAEEKSKKPKKIKF